MSAFAITPALSGVQISALEAASTKRDELLKESREVVAVTDRLDADYTSALLKEIDNFLKDIEAARVDAKRPVDDLAKRIQATAKLLTEQVQAERSRIGSVLGAFEAEERRKAAEAERKAQEEARKIREEADRKAAEAQLNAKTDEEALRASDEIQGEAAAKVSEVKQAITPAPKLSSGLRLRKVVCFEVTDAHALYADCREAVKLEPNTSYLQALIKANPNIKLNGLRHWVKEKV